MAFRAPGAPRYWNRCGVLDCSAGILLVLGCLLRVAALGRKMDFLVPHGGAEITLWIALSVTAGICEEAIFRGYLQRQFMALTKCAPAGMILSAAASGAAHAYQGFRMVILIGLYGAMFGILAHWRGSVRPGIIAHAGNDSLNEMLVGLSRQSSLPGVSDGQYLRRPVDGM